MFNYFFRSDITNPSIVFIAIGDVNGDKIPDNLYLVGTRTVSSNFIKNITLIIQDGRTNTLYTIPLKENAGYNPRLILKDFTGNGVKDILISIDSGGSGAIMYHYIYSFLYNTRRLLFDFDVYNQEYNYEITFKNNYKVQAISNKNNTEYIIDISLKGKDYLDEIYYENGNLKNPLNGFVNPLSGLYPVDFNSDGVYELLAYQKIAGRYNADSLGFFLNTLKWEYNRFNLYNQNVAIWGTQI